MFLYSRIVGVRHSVLAEVALSNKPLRGRATFRLQICTTPLVDGLVQSTVLSRPSLDSYLVVSIVAPCFRTTASGVHFAVGGFKG